jgi:hypothetical protein
MRRSVVASILLNEINIRHRSAALRFFFCCDIAETDARVTNKLRNSVFLLSFTPAADFPNPDAARARGFYGDIDVNGSAVATSRLKTQVRRFESRSGLPYFDAQKNARLRSHLSA